MDDSSYITKFETGNGNKDKFNRLETFSADGSGLTSIFVSSGSALRELSASNLVNGLDGQLTENGEYSHVKAPAISPRAPVPVTTSAPPEF